MAFLNQKKNQLSFDSIYYKQDTVRFSLRQNKTKNFRKIFNLYNKNIFASFMLIYYKYPFLFYK